MMANNQLLRIKTTWECIGDVDSILTIDITDNDLNDEHNKVEHLVPELPPDTPGLSPIFLTKPDSNSDNCLLYVRSCEGRHVIIENIEIISDIKSVEVYHVADGYLFCMRGQLSDKEQQYRCIYSLDIDCDDVYFKFPVKTDVEKVTIHSLKLVVTLGEECISGAGQSTMIDLEKVKGYLGGIPENAMGLFKNMEAYQKNQQSMTAAMMSGNSMNMGSFGMMGLMSALMGGLKGSSAVNNLHYMTPSVKETKAEVKNIKLLNENDLDKFKVHHEPKGEQFSINKEIGDAERNFSTKKMCNGHSDDADKQDKMSINGVLGSLINGNIGGQGDVEMFSMLKDICNEVSSQRRAPVKVSDREHEGIKDTSNGDSEIETRQERSFDEQFRDHLQKTEERLKLYVDQQLSSLEERLNAKLDKILTCLIKIDDIKPP